MAGVAIGALFFALMGTIVSLLALMEMLVGINVIAGLLAATLVVTVVTAVLDYATERKG